MGLQLSAVLRNYSPHVRITKKKKVWSRTKTGWWWWHVPARSSLLQAGVGINNNTTY
jgi:hypothetical protein